MTKTVDSSLTNLLDSLTLDGVRLWVDDDEVRYRAPRGVMDATRLAALRKNKEAVRELLRDGSGWLPTFWRSEEGGKQHTLRQAVLDTGTANPSRPLVHDAQGRMDASRAVQLGEVLSRTLAGASTGSGGSPAVGVCTSPGRATMVALAAAALAGAFTVAVPASATPLERARLLRQNSCSHIISDKKVSWPEGVTAVSPFPEAPAPATSRPREPGGALDAVGSPMMLSSSGEQLSLDALAGSICRHRPLLCPDANATVLLTHPTDTVIGLLEHLVCLCLGARGTVYGRPRSPVTPSVCMATPHEAAHTARDHPERLQGRLIVVGDRLAPASARRLLEVTGLTQLVHVIRAPGVSELINVRPIAAVPSADHGGPPVPLSLVGEESQRLVVGEQPGSPVVACLRRDGRAITEILEASDIDPAVRCASEDHLLADPRVAHACTIGGSSPCTVVLPARQDPTATKALDEAVTAAAQEAVRGAETQSGVSGFPHLMAKAESYALASMQAALSTLVHGSTSFAWSQVEDAVHPRLTTLVNRWRDLLCANGLARWESSRLTLSDPPSPEKTQHAWAAIDSDPTSSMYGRTALEFLHACCSALPELLTDTADPLGILFPEGSTRTAEATYRDNGLSQRLNTVVADIMSLLCDRHKPPTVLEVGAGVGGTSGPVLASLPQPGLVYQFTDVSDFFVDRARTRYASDRRVVPHVLDINRPFLAQGVPPSSIDVVLAANVLHDALDIRLTLSWVLESLTGSGWLVLLEATRESPTLMVSMGFLEGLNEDWQDERRLTGQPFRSANGWISTLEQAGFEVVSVLPSDDSPLSAAGQSVICARAADGVTPLTARGATSGSHPGPPVVVADPLPLTPDGQIDRKNAIRSRGFTAREQRREP